MKYKKMLYQINAVDAVVDCFKGQPNKQGIEYRMDPGKQKVVEDTVQEYAYEQSGFKNVDIELRDQQLLDNIHEIQLRNNIPLSDGLISSTVAKVNLDIEMETGTGKTYCYIKTIHELYRKYGWSKYVIVVPSIAIREGVYQTFKDTQDHFIQEYGKKIKFFIYNSRQLHQIEGFSSNPGINVIIINTQAFNARGKDARRIYEELDDFQTRRPIDVISANRPIMIVDEPQKIEGDTKKRSKSFDSFSEFKPLMILRYSATHKKTHNKVYRLDALDAYNQKLVKKISVRGISVKGLSGTNSYLYLESINIKPNLSARLEMEIKQLNGIQRKIVRVKDKDDLFVTSKGLEQYRGYIVSNINANTDTLEFTNGVKLISGEAVGNVNEKSLRRIQIREAIKAHLDKEQKLFYNGIKVLSLFFIDEVAKYRQYADGEPINGEYATIFQEEYLDAINQLGLIDKPEYKKYLNSIEVGKTHNGYFSIDKKSKQMVDPYTGKKSTEADDVDAYDLILKDKERLLSFQEHTRFIFSHSALREGWDNPNIFVICTLKHSDNTISRHQEVGRGLRISVDENKERTDNPAIVHKINRLTVVASESYQDFVSSLQSEVSETLTGRPRYATVDYFKDRMIYGPEGKEKVSQQVAEWIEFYLVRNGYADRHKQITEDYHKAKQEGTLFPLPDDLLPYNDSIFQLIDSVYTGEIEIENDRERKTNPLNDNFDKKEFQELWGRINKKAIYTVDFDSVELIEKCVKRFKNDLRVRPLQYTIHRGEQKDEITYDSLKSGTSFKSDNLETKTETRSAQSSIPYDLIGSIAEQAKLTRKTVTEMMVKMEPTVFKQFKVNPEEFISEAVKLITEEKATTVIEHLSYDLTDESYDKSIFTENQVMNTSERNIGPMKRHIYDYVITDSDTEKKFVNDLDISDDIVVYSKLPKDFYIPTPVGNYNPDWAIVFKEGRVKHIYFIAETKGSMSSLELRESEKTRIKCAKKFFEKLNTDKLQYDVVKDYSDLMRAVR